MMSEKYAGHKTLEQIRKQCEESGMVLDSTGHDKRGDDHVFVRATAQDGKIARIYFNTVTGTFFGTTPEDKGFNSESKEYVGQPWFDAVLDFFYLPKTVLETSLQAECDAFNANK